MRECKGLVERVREREREVREEIARMRRQV